MFKLVNCIDELIIFKHTSVYLFNKKNRLIMIILFY